MKEGFKTTITVFLCLSPVWVLAGGEPSSTFQALKTMAGPIDAVKPGTPPAGDPFYSRPILIDQVVPKLPENEEHGAKAILLLIQREIDGLCLIYNASYSGQGVNEIGPDPDECLSPLDEGQNVYTYRRDGDGGGLLYFKSSGEGVNFIKNFRMDNGFASDAAKFTGQTSNKWGLNAAAHLAEVEFNGGMGAPRGRLFIATDVKLLSIDAAKLIHRVLV